MRMLCCASSKDMLVVARAPALFRVNDTALALVREYFKGGDGSGLKLGSDTASGDAEANRCDRENGHGPGVRFCYSL